jgi:Uma2 family endonuclease
MAQEAITKTPTNSAEPSPLTKMTYEEFLEWADEDTWAEWVDGEVIQMAPASDSHQDLSGFLTALLRHFAEARQSGIVRFAPFQMKTAPNLPGREPDILFIANQHRNRLKNTYLDGPADLVVEIISRDSRSRDRGDKFYEYEQGGVREYWLLDQPRKRAEFYGLGEDGIYALLPVGKDEIFRSTVVEGLWLKVDWLWQEPLPPLLTVLKEWGLV